LGLNPKELTVSISESASILLALGELQAHSKKQINTNK
jgi:hypothetical protein